MADEDNVRTVAEKIASPSALQKFEEILLEENGLYEARMYMLGYLYAHIERTPVAAEEFRTHLHLLGFTSDEAGKIVREKLPSN